MHVPYSSFAPGLLLMAIAVGCGDKGATQKGGAPSEFLPQEIPVATLTRTSEVRTFVGDSLWEYINGGAEVYHTFGFVEVATADYSSKESELVIDVYRFETPRGAYGLLSSIRPPDPNPLSAGAEGFITSTSADFVKGSYLGRITAFQPSDGLSKTMTSAAGSLAEALPGTADLPETFALFPLENSVPHSEQIFAESFLGNQSLSWVHARKYAIANDTSTLFLVPDDADAKFDRFRLAQETAEMKLRSAPTLAFDETEGFVFEHPYYGMVAIGMRGTRLVGMINITDGNRAFFNTWLESMDNPDEP